MEQQKPQYKNQTGLRQDILSFKEDDPRRKRFFICLKMLAILPCHAHNKDLEFNMNIRTKSANFDEIDPESMIYTKPQRIHDQFIASHVTCCEHQTPFFGYYHRNLLVYTEFQLNYTDQYLRYQNPDAQQNFQKEWKNLMLEYRAIIDDMKKKNIFEEKVMLHYWNPTNYTSISGQFTGFPVELLPKKTLETVDILFEKVNSHLPWNINLRTRFYQLSTEEYRKRNVMEEMGDFFFYEENLKLNEDQKLIVSGKSNPRSSDPESVKHFFNNFVRVISSRNNRSINAIISNEASMRIRDFFLNEGKMEILPLYFLGKDEFYLNFGIGIHNQQWLNPNEIREVYSKLGNSSRMFPEYYNTLLPHYQFAYAYAKSEKSFIGNYLGGVSNASANMDYQRRMENSHNTMHNNCSFIMTDPNFSLTNLIFFLYHSWIDYELQVKIRHLSDTLSYNIARQELLYNRERTVYDVLTNEKGPYTLANYKLVDWVNPRVGAWRWNSTESHQAAKFFFDTQKIDPKKSFRYSFKSTSFLNFVLNETQKHIRCSDELNQIYKLEYETGKPNNARFSYFRNLRQYNFNYNYEIFDEGKRLVMDKPNVPVLPGYISRIVESLNARSSQVKVSSASIPQSPENIQLQGESLLDIVSSFTPIKVKEKILENPILALGKYSSMIKSNTYHIQIHFIIKEFKKFTKNLSQEDFSYIKSGFFLKAISIFSKGKASSTCPKCAPTKKFWVDVADRLRELFPQIWKVLNLFMIEKNRVIYSSSETQENNEEIQVKTSEIIKLTCDPSKFKPFSILQGAEEIEFDVVITNQGSDLKEEISLKLDLEFYSMFNQRIQGVVSKTLYSLEEQYSPKHFDFYKMLDVASSEGENNFEEFDKYYYKRVNGEIRVGELSRRFSYEIPNYHRLIRYLVRIQLIDQQLVLKQPIQINEIGNNQASNSELIALEIEDRDYQMKYDYYQNWTDDLSNF